MKKRYHLYFIDNINLYISHNLIFYNRSVKTTRLSLFLSFPSSLCPFLEMVISRIFFTITYVNRVKILTHLNRTENYY